MHNSTAILVLGMPRSGTSAVTRVLNLHGATLSENLLPAAEANPKGFFESADALIIHERLLAAMGRTWFDIGEMPDGWLEFPEAQQAQRELEALVRQDYLGEAIWVIKEPRMCRFVPLWLRVLEALNINPRVLLVARHPEEVVKSIAVMVGDDQWSPEHTKILWLEYFFEAEKETRGLLRTLITYDQLLNDWAFHVGRIARDLDIEWPISSDCAKPEVDAYLSSESRHHKSALISGVNETKLSLAEKTYSVCHEMKEDYWGTLASINSEFSFGLAFFQRPMRDLIHKVANHHANVALSQQVELDELRHHRDSLHFSHQEQLNELRRHQDSLCSSHQTELDKLKHHHNSLSLSQQSDLDKLARLLEQAEGEISVRQCEQVELTKTVEKLTVELDLVCAREKHANCALAEMEAKYSTLQMLTESRKWLMKALFNPSRKKNL